MFAVQDKNGFCVYEISCRARTLNGVQNMLGRYKGTLMFLSRYSASTFSFWKMLISSSFLEIQTFAFIFSSKLRILYLFKNLRKLPRGLRKDYTTSYPIVCNSCLMKQLFFRELLGATTCAETEPK